MSSQKNYMEAMENWENLYLFRSLSNYFDYLKMTGISLQQAYVLTYIYYQGPSKISDLCDHMLVTAAAASQMVDRLEKQDMVGRIADPEDRRVRNVVLSSEGKSIVEKSIKARQNWVKEIPVGLSDKQLDEISAALQLLISIYQD
jgi:DNA-binding MarR family transcriptional regulator